MPSKLCPTCQHWMKRLYVGSAKRTSKKGKRMYKKLPMGWLCIDCGDHYIDPLLDIRRRIYE